MTWHLQAFMWTPCPSKNLSWMGKGTVLFRLGRGAEQKNVRDATNSTSCLLQRYLARYALIGFTLVQARELQKGCDVLIATPGRLNHFIERGLVSLSHVRHMVLDEADRMLDMGFESQIRQITDDADLPKPGDDPYKAHHRCPKTGFPARIPSERHSELFLCRPAHAR